MRGEARQGKVGQGKVGLGKVVGKILAQPGVVIHPCETIEL